MGALFIDPAAKRQLLNEAESRGYTIEYRKYTFTHRSHNGKQTNERSYRRRNYYSRERRQCAHSPAAINLEMFHAEPSPPADITVKDGDLITIGETSLKVIHTPGHSPGGMCLYHNGMVFTGDTLFVGAVGRTDLGAAHGRPSLLPYAINFLRSPMRQLLLRVTIMVMRQKVQLEGKRCITHMLDKEPAIKRILLLGVLAIFICSCQTIPRRAK